MYLWLKLLHVASVIAFLGNITTGLFWHVQAARMRDARILAATMKGIIRSDRLFTVPGVVGIVGTGIAMALLAGFPLLRTAWIGWSLALFALSGAVFMWQVAPLQRRLLALAQAGEFAAQFDYPAYAALARRWEWWGGVALMTPVGALFLMVLKPQA